MRQQLAERAAFFVRREGEGAAAFAARIYSRAFGADIERLLRITSLWEKPGRVAPTALPAADAGVSGRVGELLSGSAACSSACASLGLCNQNALWSRDEAQAVFLLALARLAMLQQSHAGAPLTFDKDDALAVEVGCGAGACEGARLVGAIQVRRGGVVGRVDGDRRDAEFRRSAQDARRDLPSIGDQELPHRNLSPAANPRLERRPSTLFRGARML